MHGCDASSARPRPQKLSSPHPLLYRALSMPRAADRQNSLKKGIDVEEQRRRRVESSYELRKKNREATLNKRRNETQDTAAPGTAVGDASLLPQLDQINQLAAQVVSGNPQQQLEATRLFRRLLSIERAPPIDQVIATGVIPHFVEFLKIVDNPDLQFEAAWALTNIASGTTNHARLLIECGAVHVFIQLLSSPSDEVREQSIWALGNIAGDNTEFRDIVLDSGILAPLLANINDQSRISMLRTATWTLSNLCRGKAPPEFAKVIAALPVLVALIYRSNDVEVMTDACWALSYLSDGPNDKIQAVIETGAVARLVELLNHPKHCIQTPALRTVGNIVTGTDKQTQIVLDHLALSFLAKLLSHAKKNIRKEACWTISNITAGSVPQIQAVIDQGIVPELIKLLSAEIEVRKEAAWAISNATSGGTPEQIDFMVRLGTIKPLCDLLTVNDPRILAVALEGLENILKAGEALNYTNGGEDYRLQIEGCGGLDQLEELQSDANDNVKENAERIIRRFWPLEDEETTDLAPMVDASGTQYNFGAGANYQQQSFNFDM